jgi:hypothetical protein
MTQPQLPLKYDLFDRTMVKRESIAPATTIPEGYLCIASVRMGRSVLVYHAPNRDVNRSDSCIIEMYVRSGENVSDVERMSLSQVKLLVSQALKPTRMNPYA